MGSHSLPSPPAEDHKHPSSHFSRKSSGTKPVKAVHRTAKKVSSGAAAAHHHDHVTQGAGMDGRHKRVWKACERCRMKKTKCDGEFPCKRCKDDGLVCTAGVRKKVEYKQLPRGYAEVLENTQFALIATVHKLYSMVRSGQQWDLGEPELNERGQPVIHNIAQKLGCIRPNSDIDLPVHSVFPEDEATMAELARQLEEQQAREQDALPSISSPQHAQDGPNEPDYSLYGTGRADRASSSELDHSDLETDYRRMAFGGGLSNGSSDALTLSPQSFTTSADFDFPPQPQSFSTPSPPLVQYPTWGSAANGEMATLRFLQQQQQQQQQNPSLDMLNQGLLESEFGTIKPHVLSCANPQVMMGMGDPMIYSGYEGEPMRL